MSTSGEEVEVRQQPDLDTLRTDLQVGLCVYVEGGELEGGGWGWYRVGGGGQGKEEPEGEGSGAGAQLLCYSAAWRRYFVVRIGALSL